MNALKPHPRDDNVTAVLGPTNTGKTHYAIERMLAHRSGVIGFPLRLLAREVYDRVVALRGPRAAALITGEEKIAPADAAFVICTVESMPLDWGAEFLAVDEIQLCADPERGHIFTDRLLRARGSMETLFLGSESMRPRIASLIPKARFMNRPRFSTLSYAGSKKISRLAPRSAVVGFSVDGVYAIAELLRRQKGGAAVVMGALSPRTRNAQVELYQNGDVEHLVATDAIGMGLNLDLNHVAFSGTAKFDGRRRRPLGPQELAQIAGRAGRHTSDGTFGVTGEARPLDADVVERIENHRFDSVAKLQWRNSRLEFGSTAALLRSLEAPSPHPDLVRARDSDDLLALRGLCADKEIADRAKGGPAVRLLWDLCQIPDFRKTGQTDHLALISRIYGDLLGEAAAIPPDWMETQLRRLDRIEGDIDTLSKRLAFVRTWTYVANRGRWLDDPATWRERTRAVEDRLSDALHARLTQRFVDRRTGALMRRLKQKERLVAEVSDTGDVAVEGHHVGKLEGFRFRPDPDASAEEAKTLRSASLQALQAQFQHRADKFYNAPDTEIEATDQGGLMWGTDAVGRLEKGADPLSPEIRPFVDEAADPAVAEKVQRRLSHWIDRRVKALFEPLIGLRDDAALTGMARGVAFQLVEALGVIPRRVVAEDVKALDQESRSLLRKHGVRFGQHHVFMPALLKPAPTRLRLLLWGVHEGFDELPEPPPPGLVTIARMPGAPDGFYPRAGYRLAGERALRIDMLERLADFIRPLDARAGFEATPDMLSITGCTLDQFADLMKGLGYAAERGERAKPVRAGAQGDAGANAPEAETAIADLAATPESEASEPQAADALAEGAAEAALVDETTATQDAQAEATGATPAERATTPQDAPVETTEAPPVEAAEATQDITAGEATAEQVPSPDASAATDTEAAPGESADAAAMEVFYTFTIAPRRQNRRPQGGGRRRESAPAAKDGAKPDNPKTENGGEPHRRSDKGKGKGKGRPRNDGDGANRKGPRRGEKGGETPKRFTSSPRAEARAADPDNPFAALKALKDKL